MSLDKHHNDHALMLSPGSSLGLIARVWDAGLPAFRRWRERRKLENRISVVIQHGDARIDAVDKGEVSFRLAIANFTSDDVNVDHVEIDSWRLGTNSLGRQSAYLKASG